MKQKRLEKPDALLVTMSKENVVEWGGLETLDRFFAIQYGNENENTWWYKIGANFPIHQDILHVYLVIGNEIRWRFNFVGFQDCPDGVELYKNGKLTTFKGKFVILTGPTVKAPKTFPFKGFQGFRYSQILY